MRRDLIVGEARVTVEADSGTSFLSVLRDSIGRKSVVRGCANGQCGACRVLVNGAIVASCALSLRDVPEGATVLAREDLDAEPDVARTIAAFEAERPTRCRLCVGGLAVTAHHLAEHAALPTAKPMTDAIEASLAQATCMCTGRGSLRRALVTALVRE